MKSWTLIMVVASLSLNSSWARAMGKRPSPTEYFLCALQNGDQLSIRPDRERQDSSTFWHPDEPATLDRNAGVIVFTSGRKVSVYPIDRYGLDPSDRTLLWLEPVLENTLMYGSSCSLPGGGCTGSSHIGGNVELGMAWLNLAHPEASRWSGGGARAFSAAQPMSCRRTAAW